MTAVQWGSLIADKDGRICFSRVRSLAAVVLAFAAGMVMLFIVFVKEKPPTDLVVIMVSSMLAPLTGGKIAEGLGGLLASRRIQAGAAPGRRASDSHTAVDASATSSMEPGAR